jgi:hypothetical protein
MHTTTVQGIRRANVEQKNLLYQKIYDRKLQANSGKRLTIFLFFHIFTTRQGDSIFIIMPPPIPKRIEPAYIVIGLLALSLVALLMIQEEEEQKRRDALPEVVATFTLGQKRSKEGPTEPKKRSFIRWDHDRARRCIEEDYWGPLPRFNDPMFERVFRVTRSIANKILLTCAASDSFFRVTTDCTGKLSICPKAKILIALKILGFGVSPAAFQDYFQMGISTAHMCLKCFCYLLANDPTLNGVYRRRMSRADAKRLSDMHSFHHGVPGMVGSIDCMHVGWRLCPVAWQGQFEGAKKRPTLILEACADYTLWLWHSSFNHPGSLNDINVWDRSPLLEEFLDGTFSSDVDFEFNIDGRTFHQVRYSFLLFACFFFNNLNLLLFFLYYIFYRFGSLLTESTRNWQDL